MSTDLAEVDVVQSSTLDATSNEQVYNPGNFYDEMFQGQDCVRETCQSLHQSLAEISPEELFRRQQAADRSMIQLGITFNVYEDSRGTERAIPFDIIPRVIEQKEWSWIEAGLKQRITALNLFLQDIYNQQMIVRDGVIPEEVIQTSRAFRHQCIGITPPKNIWCHITGTDLVRHNDGQLYVLEDNLRCPSGVSYVLQNRRLMKRSLPTLFQQSGVRPVDDYCSRLLDALQYLVEDTRPMAKAAVLSPGAANSAYFEHSFLAQQMGIELVEGRDLVVSKGDVYMRTTKGLEKIDVLYRRIDDDFLDPKAFRQDSMLGVSGLMESYRSGQIALANAPGTGVADDKGIYTYVPSIIRYYLNEYPIIPNVPTFACWRPSERDHVLTHLDELVVKPVNEAGGYGLMIGPHASVAERKAMAERIRANPRNYIAQPTLSLSRVPVVTPQGLKGRHVDLRPFTVYGRDVFVLPGGLTRVALEPGSLVVNSSQGGGSKDTWVLS